MMKDRAVVTQVALTLVVTLCIIGGGEWWYRSHPIYKEWLAMKERQKEQAEYSERIRLKEEEWRKTAKCITAPGSWLQQEWGPGAYTYSLVMDKVCNLGPNSKLLPAGTTIPTSTPELAGMLTNTGVVLVRTQRPK